MASLTPTRMSSTDRRTQVLAVAAQEFADGGLRGASIEAIARAAGITQPYVFRIFGSKKALFLEVVADSFDQLVGSMQAAAEGATGLDALSAMGARYNALLADRTALQLQLQAYAACGDPEVREAVRDHLARLWNTVAGTTGLDAVTVKTFLAYGMLLNTNAALGLAAGRHQVGAWHPHPDQGGPVPPHHQPHEPMSRPDLTHRFDQAPSVQRSLPTALILIALLVASVGSLGAPLITQVAASYHVSLAAAQWTLTVTLLSGAVATPLIGRLGVGRRRRTATLATLTVVTAGSVCTVLPGPFALLIVGRAAQGVGLGLGPLLMATARDVFDRRRAAGVIAMLSVATTAAIGVGYPLSGLLADLGGVRAAYVVGLVATAAALLIGARALPRPRVESRRTPRLDWVGAALLGGALVAVLIPLGDDDLWAGTRRSRDSFWAQGWSCC